MCEGSTLQPHTAIPRSKSRERRRMMFTSPASKSALQRRDLIASDRSLRQAHSGADVYNQSSRHFAGRRTGFGEFVIGSRRVSRSAGPPGRRQFGRRRGLRFRQTWESLVDSLPVDLSASACQGLARTHSVIVNVQIRGWASVAGILCRGSVNTRLRETNPAGSHFRLRAHRQAGGRID